MKLFKRPQTESKLEIYSDFLPEVDSGTPKQPIRYKGLHMKWKIVDGKLTRRWFHEPD